MGAALQKQDRCGEPNYQRTRMQKDVVIQELKKRGCRITKQRRMLLEVILENECSCCKEIYYNASRLDLGIGSATGRADSDHGTDGIDQAIYGQDQVENCQSVGAGVYRYEKCVCQNVDGNYVHSLFFAPI